MGLFQLKEGAEEKRWIGRAQGSIDLAKRLPSSHYWNCCTFISEQINTNDFVKIVELRVALDTARGNLRNRKRSQIAAPSSLRSLLTITHSIFSSVNLAATLSIASATPPEVFCHITSGACHLIAFVCSYGQFAHLAS